MPAPQRKPKQTVSIANDAIFAKEEEEIPFKPVIVRAPGQTNGDSLERFTEITMYAVCLLYTSPSPRDGLLSRMPSSA